MSTGLSTNSDFRPVTQGFGEIGEFDPRVWQGSRQNNKKKKGINHGEKRLPQAGGVSAEG